MTKKFFSFIFLFMFFCGQAYCLNDTGYIIGMGDVIKIDFIGARYMTSNFTVDNNGFISIPKYGKYYIENKSVYSAQNELSKIYVKSLVNPEIEIFLVKSYKDEQNEQNKDFANKLDIIKNHYLARNYKETIDETRNLLDLLTKINERDYKVKSTPKFNIEISDLSYSFSGDTNNIYELTGKLKNNSNVKYYWIKSKISFFSESGKLLNFKESYLVKDIPVSETQIIPFESKGAAPAEAVKLEIELTDYLIPQNVSE